MQFALEDYLLGLLEAIPILIRCTALPTQNCYENASHSRFGTHPQRPETPACQRYFPCRSFHPPLEKSRTADPSRAELYPNKRKPGARWGPRFARS